MDSKNGGEERAAENSTSHSLCEALLFTTMCLVGLPVEVQVKDGSIYSGIFHTARVYKDYGIVLKKARKIGKERCDATLERGALIDTLVVLSGDLVQVVAKGVLLPAEGVAGNVPGDGVEAGTGTVLSRACNGELEPEPMALKSESTALVSRCRTSDQIEGKTSLLSIVSFEDIKANGELARTKTLAKPSELTFEVEDGKVDSNQYKKIKQASLSPNFSIDDRQGGEDRLQGEDDHYNRIYEAPLGNTKVNEVQSPSSCSDAFHPQVGLIVETHVDLSTKMVSNGEKCGSSATSLVGSEAPDRENMSSLDEHSSPVSTSPNSALDMKLSCNSSAPTQPVLPVPLIPSIGNTSSKEFKLNPGAKTFSPAFTNTRVAPPTISTVTNLAYTTDGPTMVPIAGAQSLVEISPYASRLSMPTKIIQYNDVTPGISGISSQYSRPIIGHVGTRQQTGRLSVPYHPLQAGPAYIHPNSQMVMVGRLGQLVYVHPASQDAMQGTTLSQLAPRPILTSYQTTIPKLPGNAAHMLPVCVNPSLIAGGQQPFTVPSHVPYVHPFPEVHPITIPGGNVFGGKFL